MTATETTQRLREILAQTFAVPATQITEATGTADLDGWDSLGHATLLLRLQRVFNVEFPPEQAAAAQTFGALAALIADSQQTDRTRQQVENVVVGTDGHYWFHRDHQAFEQITGQINLTAAELRLWARCIETRHAWCAARGIPYIHMVAPEKHVVYQDLLPPSLRPASDRAVHRLFQAVSGPARAAMLYPLAALRDGRRIRQTYHANDTHWTMYGAFLAYRAMMRVAQRSLPVGIVAEDRLRFVKRRFVGDLGARVSPEWAVDECFIEPPSDCSGRLIFDNKVFERGNVAVYRGPNDAAPRAMIFRDSFSTDILPHLIPVFSRLTVVASPRVLYDLILADRPDIVFFEIVERFLAYDLADSKKVYTPNDFVLYDTADYIGIDPKDLAALR